MIINLSGEVNEAMMNNLVASYNTSFLGKLHIYFSSPEGGYVSVAEAIVDLINLHKDKIKITFYGENFSCGMIIFLKTNCEKSILPFTTGMYHFSYQNMSISEGGKPNSDYDLFAMKEMKSSKLQTLNYLKSTHLLEKEISAIKKGKDVYFSFNRMNELLNAI